MSTRPDIPAEVRQFPRDFPPDALALADAAIDRTRGPDAITTRRAIAELVIELWASNREKSEA